jgi:hypothetical protein
MLFGLSKKAQVTLEFLLLITFGTFFLLVLLVVLNKISADNAQHRNLIAVEDLGSSIKNELITASEMENGYLRNLELPPKINERTYTILLNDSATGSSYIVINAGNIEMYFSVPKSSGTLAPGQNIISKLDNLTISHVN